MTVGLRLFLPETWTGDPDRMARARVPEDRQIGLSKPEIAIGLRIERAFPPLAEHTRPRLGSRSVAAPERLSG